MDRPFTAESAAEYLGCSKAHVHNMCKAGKLRHFYFGRLLRIPASAIEELERCGSSCTEEPTPPTGATRRARHTVDPYVPPIVLPPPDFSLISNAMDEAIISSLRSGKSTKDT